MKKYLISLILFLLPSFSNSEDGIFFLDIDYLLNTSNYGKKIILKFKKIHEKNLIEINNYEDELKKEDDELNRIKSIITDEELNIKLSKLKQNVLDFRKKKEKIFKEYEDLKNKEIEIFFKKIRPYIEEFMEIKSIKLIMNKKNIFIANSKYDITIPLVEFLNLKLKNE